MKNQVRFAVQQAFVGVFYATRIHQSWQQTAALFQKAARISAQRLAEGDVGGYEQQRLDLEARQYQQREREAHLALAECRQRLVLLLDPGTEAATLELAGEFPLPAPEISVEELTAQALSRRPDLRAARAQLNSAGYKQQEDRFKGMAVQLEMELPLFDRAQGEILSARARREQQALAVALLERQVIHEVQQPYRRVQLYREQLAALAGAREQPFDALLEIAQYSYAEGELDLVELLDGIRAYSVGVQARYGQL